MVNHINKVLGIQSGDSEKLLQLGPIFLLTGLAYIAGIISVQSLFISRFGVAYLPLMYLLEAGILPLQLWMFSYFSRKLMRGAFLKALYLIIMFGVLVCALCILLMLGLDLQCKVFYPLLFIIVNILLRILVPLLWTLGEGICSLQQAKRIFPFLGALFTLGAILAGLLGRILPVYFQGCGTELLFLFVPALLLVCLFHWRRLTSHYFLVEGLEDGNKHGAPMSRVIKTIWLSPFFKISLLSFVLLLSLFYVLDYEFFLFMAARYPVSDAMTQYFSLFTAVVYVCSFMVGLFLNRLINAVGIGNTVFLMGFTVFILFAGTGFMTQSPWALEFFAVGDLMLDILSFTLLPPISQIFYKLLPLEQRAGASLFFAGSINAGGKLISAAITGLHSSGMTSLTVLSIAGILLGAAYFYLTGRQKHLYLSTLLGSLESHAIGTLDLNDFAPGKLLGKSDIGPILDALQSTNPAKASVALELSVHINHEMLFTALQPFLSHPDPWLRHLAFQAILKYKEASEDILVHALQDTEPEIRSTAIRQLKRILKNDPQLRQLISEMLHDTSPLVISEVIMALYDNSDLTLQNQLTAQIQTMLKGDDENRFQACRAVRELRMRQYAPQIVAMLNQELSSRIRIAAVECLGVLGFLESLPLLLEFYPHADRELRKSIENALIEMGHAAIPELSKNLDNNDIDIWYLSVVSLSSLDKNHELVMRLYQSCTMKLNGFYRIRTVPLLLEKERVHDLAGLYRLRLRENYERIEEACWKALSISIDPLLLDRLKESLKANPAGDKREQAIEILSEFSRRHTLIVEMLRVLYRDPPVLAEPQVPPIQSLKDSIPAFPDPWLNRFANYAVTHFEKGDA